MTDWVSSMGGPLVVVPVTVLREWGGCTDEGIIVGEGDEPDDYDRACGVDELAGVIDVGSGGGRALVLGDEPAMTMYLPERRAFVRWIGAYSEEELVAEAEAVLDAPGIPWEECGVWETDGAAVLMDSAEAGADLGVPYPGGTRMPEQADVLVPAGRWRIGAHQASGESASVGVVRLLPE
ncbi:Imm21 family immunity protein [Streptomyces venezuelae]|uniref:Imm21 family immunity protein n=1 Tax=Streptomyces gardneri TaxID=66892 RepID=UPI0006E18AFC|nr:Imm21 family immunity protein [Streptomyces gardneri]WRK36483.1 Imm21 family immunity protein [Streptomyces venezuelae]